MVQLREGVGEGRQLIGVEEEGGEAVCVCVCMCVCVRACACVY